MHVCHVRSKASMQESKLQVGQQLPRTSPRSCTMPHQSRRGATIEDHSSSNACFHKPLPHCRHGTRSWKALYPTPLNPTVNPLNPKSPKSRFQAVTLNPKALLCNRFFRHGISMERPRHFLTHLRRFGGSLPELQWSNQAYIGTPL